MPFILTAWWFLVGACVGSFINVVVWRLPLDKSLLYPPSHCPRCFKPIPLCYNVPVLGWVVLGGKSACCGTRIGIRYPLVELWCAVVASGLWYWLVVMRGAPVPVFVIYATTLILLTAGTLTDFDHMVIPRQIPIVGLVVALVISFAFPSVPRWFREPLEGLFARLGPDGGYRYDAELFMGWLRGWPRLDGLAQSAAGALTGFGVLWLVRTLGSLAFRKEVMGLGDLDLMAFVGAVIGPRCVVAAFFLGVGVALAGTFVLVLVRRSTEGLKDPFPFGPALAVGSALVMLLWHHGLARPIVYYEAQFRFMLGLQLPVGP